MTETGPAPGPRRLEERNVPPALQGLVSRLLRVGVVASGALLLAGLVWEAARGSGGLVSSAAPDSRAGFSALLAHGGPSALVVTGMLILIVTPLSRVTISVALFSAARDRPFTLITLFVLAILAATIGVGVLR